MSINIKNREAEALLDEIKAASGKGTSEVLGLLRKEAEALRKQRDFDGRKKRIEEISLRYRAGLREPVLSPDEIVGYDENGLRK